MKPWELLGRTEAPDGGEMTLMRRDREYVIFSRGELLMSSRMFGSETALAALACECARKLEAPCVLVGGLGLGYTLRATLDLLPRGATVVVAELVQAVVDWNLGPLAPLAGEPLREPRGGVALCDVGEPPGHIERVAGIQHHVHEEVFVADPVQPDVALIVHG